LIQSDLVSAELLLVFQDETVASQVSLKDKILGKPKQWKQKFKDNKIVKKYLHDPQPIPDVHQYFGMVSTHRGRSKTDYCDYGT
jgi:hypothetical protein